MNSRISDVALQAEKIRALAIDFDGVLADSQPLHLLAWQQALRAAGIRRRLAHADIVSLPVTEFIHSFGPEVDGAKLAAHKSALVLELGRKSPPPLYPCVAATLPLLAVHCRLAVVSCGERELVQHTLVHSGIQRFFETSVLEGDYQRPKPAPDPYQVCLARLGLPAQQVVAVEDSEAGVASAKAAGLAVIALPNTSGRARLKAADRIVESFSALRDLFPPSRLHGSEVPKTL